ncbi:hypothetical protein A3G63_01815 [Candidatus Kaiserbacteria bacterium RIFCSPLOWO2_12_FULL_52_8]|uniref:Fibronectin type-III domain-containing protein n=1 Tax=Candidatus Kaiserbacteria bacterium RIFCSPHIGHO2_01_FULL_53_31 TaxID=1798481 RepID=A0A1F6CI78_9BACT|nr:MAG: hypothetical protein A2678_02690 [Candidatus Kaiserbacteria bacterium RIFCSPHIGHO2_01_FULL_53_31]OGG94429.1 MAG: hypothetical protein A3G63_01815 [Candidatus Kaiserbacteria bacterium RIFCSPLOWO2_12_FULL_52_8]
MKNLLKQIPAFILGASLFAAPAFAFANQEQRDDWNHMGLGMGFGLSSIIGQQNNLGRDDDCRSATTTARSARRAAVVKINKIAASTHVSSTTITWRTNRPSTSKVFYGLTAPLNLTSSSTPFVLDATLTKRHQIIIPTPDVATSTIYHYVVQSTDALGRTATSSDRQILIP